MIETNVEVVETVKRAGNAKSIRFKKTDEMSFRPGQYMLVTARGAGKEIAKPLSFSSSPTETGYVEFTKRLTGSDFSNALDALRPGDTLKVKMPYGQFIFEGELPKIAMLAGGIGVTPFKSICKYATDRSLDSDIVLLFSSRDEDSIVFREEFDSMRRENDRLHVVYTVTDPAAVEKGCTCGRTGAIDHCMIPEVIPDYRERVFFVSGPPGMVMCLVGVLQNDLGIAPEMIRTERFAGYE